MAMEIAWVRSRCRLPRVLALGAVMSILVMQWHRSRRAERGLEAPSVAVEISEPAAAFVTQPSSGFVPAAWQPADTAHPDWIRHAIERKLAERKRAASRRLEENRSTRRSTRPLCVDRATRTRRLPIDE